ncbi:hypothetical protein [Giesbergeria sp.]|uniref:hypothetical protein n=1 Tax=Giesbergeria sp. TaxID=2818473 RepID=UPI00262F8A21|nr:hypothetical protein [Giesbergeria sp.]
MQKQQQNMNMSMNKNAQLVPKRAIGGLVKSQTLYLHSGLSNGHSLQANVNGLIRCKTDEIMRVSLASLNAFNSFMQINDNNNIIYKYGGAHEVPHVGFRYTPPSDIATKATPYILPKGNYQMTELAKLVGDVAGLSVSYGVNTNKMTITSGGPVALYFHGTLAVIMGFSSNYQPAASTHYSDDACMPHAQNDIICNLDGVSPHEGSPPIDNMNLSDACDVGQVIAIIPVGAVFQRSIWYNSSAEFNSFFIAEKSVNTLNIRLTDIVGRPLTWMNNSTTVSLLFETFQIE